MRDIENDTNHEETSCGMDCTVSELHRTVLKSTRYLCRGLFGILWFVWAGFHQNLDLLFTSFVAVTIMQA